MSSYNHEKFISEAIESVLGQDFDDLELIVVDDASTDASRQIIQKYTVEDARVRVILHETNCGIAPTKNDGIAIAQGKFLAFIDSDDVWMQDKLSKQLAVLESNEDLIVWTEGDFIDEAGHRIGLTNSQFIAEHAAIGTIGHAWEKKSGNVFQSLSRVFYILCSSPIFKKENLGGIRFDTHLPYSAHDWKLYLELAANYEFYFIPESLIKYRIHANNTCSPGTGGPQGGDARVAHQEEIIIHEYALSQWHHRMSAEDRATQHMQIGAHYYKLGKHRKALMCFCRAFASDPFLRSNLQYPRRFFQFMQDTLGHGIQERT
jgi:glycosyltransferase involved in cell wall biosynthesis